MHYLKLMGIFLLLDIYVLLAWFRCCERERCNFRHVLVVWRVNCAAEGRVANEKSQRPHHKDSQDDWEQKLPAGCCSLHERWCISTQCCILPFQTDSSLRFHDLQPFLFCFFQLLHLINRKTWVCDGQIINDVGWFAQVMGRNSDLEGDYGYCGTFHGVFTDKHGDTCQPRPKTAAFLIAKRFFSQYGILLDGDNQHRLDAATAYDFIKIIQLPVHALKRPKKYNR